MPDHPSPWTRHSVCLAALLALTACGGGGGDDNAAAPSPTPAPSPAPAPSPNNVTLQGQVTIGGPVQGASVCLDSNANNQCDAGEPSAASATGADGKYSLSASAAQAKSGARLIAQIQTSSRDTDWPNEEQDNHTLTRPADSDGSINPLTTLVQAGIKDGMTEDSARNNVVLQLGLSAASKIDNYQDDPATGADKAVQDTARWIAAFTTNVLADGVTLKLVDQSAAQNGMQFLTRLLYTDPGNWLSIGVESQAKAVGADPQRYQSIRAGKSSGADITNNNLYSSAYLTADSWKLCTRDSPVNTTSNGTPSKSKDCNAVVSIGFNKTQSIAGQSMAALVDRWASEPSSNRINNDGRDSAPLKTKLGTASFPADSTEQQRYSLTLTQPLQIDNVNTRALAATRGSTLAEVIDKHPIAAADVSTATKAGASTLSLGLGSGATKNMRTAFSATSATAGTAQYFECDLDAAGVNFAAPPNCKSTSSGTYSIETIHGAKVMRFAGHPPVVSSLAYTVVYTEADLGAGSRVYRANDPKADVERRYAESMRLNNTAWQAMRTALGM